jgi:hypothetical protein
MEKINYDYLIITIIIVIFIGCVLNGYINNAKNGLTSGNTQNGLTSGNTQNGLTSGNTQNELTSNKFEENINGIGDVSNTYSNKSQLTKDNNNLLKDNEYNKELLPIDEVTLLNGNIIVLNDNNCNDKLDFNNYYTSKNPYIVKSTFILY